MICTKALYKAKYSKVTNFQKLLSSKDEEPVDRIEKSWGEIGYQKTDDDHER